MKDIYSAVRHFFADLTCARSSFLEAGGAIAPPLRKALHNFEIRNRGHQHLLAHESLRVTSVEDKPAPDSPYNAATLRNTIAASFLDLFHYAMYQDLPHKRVHDGGFLSRDLSTVFDAKDELGYIETMLKFELRSFCETESFTGKTVFDIVSLRLEVDVQPVVMHLRIRIRDGRVATRSLKLDRGNLNTLRGACLLLNQACVRLEPMLQDVSTWPEFQSKEIAEPASAPSEPDSAPQAAPSSELFVQQEAPAEPAPPKQVSELDDPEVAAFMARLKHDMRGFLNAYSPLTRAFMEKHWDSFRSIVNEPPAQS